MANATLVISNTGSLGRKAVRLFRLDGQSTGNFLWRLPDLESIFNAYI